MEASEKPQLSLDDPAGGGTVRVVEDRLVIERLTVTDERSARVVRERAGAGHEPAHTVRDAIEIGARVLEREGTAAEVEYVRHELAARLGDLREQLGGTLADGAKTLTDQIAAAFGPERNDSVQSQIRDIVKTGSTEQMQALTRLLSAEDASNPLVAVQARLGKAMLEAEQRHRHEVERLRDAYGKEARALQEQLSAVR